MFLRSYRLEKAPGLNDKSQRVDCDRAATNKLANYNPQHRESDQNQGTMVINKFFLLFINFKKNVVSKLGVKFV